MKILNKIKKHFNKILITCLTLISSIAIFSSINKTYAYETNQFSYTINSLTENNTDMPLAYTTINNINGYTLKSIYQNSSEYYFNFTLNQNDYNNISVNTNYTFLINFYLIDYNNNIINNYNNTSSNKQINLYNLDNNNIGTSFNGVINYRLVNYNNMYTIIGNTYTPTTIVNNLFMVKINTNNSSQALFITNIDFVLSNDEIYTKDYVQNYYGNLANAYEQLEDNYEQLQNDYNDLQDNYQDLEDNYNTLEDNYNTLEDNYNDLQEQYQTTEQKNLENQLYNQYGDLYNSSLQIDTTINGTTTSHVLTFNDMITNNIISNSYLYYNNAFNYLNINTSIGFTTTTLNLAKPINTSNLNWVYNNENISGITFDLEYIDTNEETFNASFSTEQATPIQLNTELLLTKQLGNIDINNLYFDEFILNFNYETINPVWISNNTNYASSYNNGYNNGYKQAYEKQNNEYQPIIRDLRNQIEILNNQITQQRVVINALQEQIASISDDYNLNNLMWTIAGTPFESFKQIWNVNFLGVNISQMVTGIITAFIVLYIVKKFFL